jgi:hypothetical protein
VGGDAVEHEVQPGLELPLRVVLADGFEGVALGWTTPGLPSQILSFLVGAVMLSVTNYLPQYMQFVRGASPTASGMLLLLPLMGLSGHRRARGYRDVVAGTMR